MRTLNSIRNIIYGLVGQLIAYILTFIVRTVFIKNLGVQYLGVNGLFTNILSVLSLAELGVGWAITFSLYKPLAENDKYKIKALLRIFGQVYRAIGIVILLIGLTLLPFLNFMIKGQADIPNIKLIYLLFLINSVSSYFFSYRYSIIDADQKGYISSRIRYFFSIVLGTLQAIFLVLTKNFIIYLLLQITIGLIQNIYLSEKASRLYPYIKGKNNAKLNKADTDDLLKKIRAMMFQKIGSVSLYTTDNIIISTFVGIYWVGIYSNYAMIINMMTGLLSQIYSSLAASVGNMAALETKEKNYSIFIKILFATFWISGFCSISFLSLFNNFIYIWVGEKYELSFSIVLIIVINFFLYQQRSAVTTFINSMGLFWHTRYIMFIACVLNVILSIFLVNKIGIAGTLLGTTIANLATNFWFEPYILFEYGLDKNIWIYFKYFIVYFIVLAIATIVTIFICSFIKETSVITLLSRVLVCTIIPNFIFFMFFRKSDEFIYFKNIVTKSYYSAIKKSFV